MRRVFRHPPHFSSRNRAADVTPPRFPQLVLLFILLVLLPGCGSESDSTEALEAQSSGEGVLWESPEVPGPYAMSLDGVEVPSVVIREFLTPEWTRFFLSQEDNANHISDERLAQISDGFFADPATLMQPLIRDLLLIRRHEEDHGEVNAHDFEHFTEEFEANAGGSREVLLNHLGEDGLRQHLERRFRLRVMMKEFNAMAECVTEAEIEAYFESKREEVRANMLANSSASEAKVDELLTLSDPTLKQIIEARLQQERIEERVDLWILSIADDTKVVFTGPNGKAMELPVQAR